MCVVSMITENWRPMTPIEHWQHSWDRTSQPNRFWPEDVKTRKSKLTSDEYESLKQELKELRELLIAAKKYDEATGQKDCEKEDKVKFIKELAEHLNVDLSEIL